MARQLEAFPQGRGQQRYDWNRLLDGSVWALTPGEDFNGKSSTFRANAKTQARRRGGDVRTRLSELDGHQVLVIQFQRS